MILLAAFYNNGSLSSFFKGVFMSNIVKFPHWIKNITNTFDTVIESIGIDNVALIHDLRIKRDEVIVLVNKHQDNTRHRDRNPIWSGR